MVAPIPDSLGEFSRGAGAFLIALCLWNSPLPLLHAHPSEAQDPATQFGEHLRDCHWRTGGQIVRAGISIWCCGGRFRRIRDSEAPPPQPRRSKIMRSPVRESTVRDLAESVQVLSDQYCDVSRILSDINSEQIGFSRPSDLFRFECQSCAHDRNTLLIESNRGSIATLTLRKDSTMPRSIDGLR